MGLSPFTAPSAEPLTVAEAKAQVRVEASADDDDTYLSALITAARRQAEASIKRALITQTWDWTLDAFPRSGWAFQVPKPTLQSVTSISYVDTAGATQTLAVTEYQVDAASEPGRIAEAFGKTWPATRADLNAVTVRFAAGYGDAATDVPETIKQGMLLLIGTWYRNRESVITGTIATKLPDGVEALWAPHRITRF